MKCYKKLIVFILALIITAGLSSCSIVKKYISSTDDTEVKDTGFVESKESELFGYDVFKDYIEIKSYKGKDTAVIIPDYIDGKKVTTIGSLAFYKSKTPPVTITLPKTLTNIKSKGFYYCEDLTELVIPDSVTTIGEHAFAWCSSLTIITLPKGLTEIQSYTFNNCAALQSILIPKTVTKIGMRSFSWCESLKRVDLPSSVVSIGENAFINCSLLEYVIIPKSVTEVGIGVFKNCPVLTIVAEEGSTAFKYASDNSFTPTTSRPADEVSLESITE